MPITHTVVKVPGNTLAAVADWNANHAISAGTILRSATLIVAASDSNDTTNADYFCDGVADEVQINAAITALPATGGSVVLMDGTFDVDASILINKNKVSLIGQGKSTIIQTDTVMKIVDTSTDSSEVVIRDIYFKGINTFGCYGIYLDGSYNLVDRCYFYYCYYSIYIMDDYNMVTNCHFNNGYYAIYLIGANYNGITGCHSSNNNTHYYFAASTSYNKIVGCSFSGGTYHVRFNGGNFNTLVGCTSVGSSIAFAHIGTNGFHTIVNGNIISGGQYGVYMRNANYCTVSGNNSRYANTFVYIESCSNSNISENVVYDTDSVHGIWVKYGGKHNIVGNDFAKIDRHGIYIYQSNHNIISSNNIHDCSEDGNDTYSGIYLTNTSTYNVISGNRVSADAGNKHKYGIREAAAADDFNNVTGNTCTDAVTANISLQGLNDEEAHNIAP